VSGTVVFPRYAEDIISQRRTLFHAVDDKAKVGEQLCLVGHHGACRGIVATVVDVRRVHFGELSAEDEVKLNCSKADYLARWMKLHPDSGDWVFAIEFRYGFADEPTART
jgi:hypothetical protein